MKSVNECEEKRKWPAGLFMGPSGLFCGTAKECHLYDRDVKMGCDL